jgi:hypothetical protein
MVMRQSVESTVSGRRCAPMFLLYTLSPVVIWMSEIKTEDFTTLRERTS